MKKAQVIFDDLRDSRRLGCMQACYGISSLHEAKEIKAISLIKPTGVRRHPVA